VFKNTVICGRVCTHKEEQIYLNGLVKKYEGRNHLKNLGVNRRIILKWILNRMGGLGLV
jgi:hypothetical protein